MIKQHLSTHFESRNSTVEGIMIRIDWSIQDLNPGRDIYCSLLQKQPDQL